MPQKPEEYALRLPKNYQAPQGIEFVPNDSDPLLPQARQLMHDIDQGRLSGQDAFEQIVGLYAASKVSTQQQITDAKAAEVQKLGANGTARKSAADTWLRAELGDEHGAEMSKYLFSAKQVEAVEKLIAKARTQGAHSYSNQHRDPDTPPTLSDSDYEKLTFAEKREYAAKHQQPAPNGAGR